MASQNAGPGSGALPEAHDFASWKHPYLDTYVYMHRDLVHRLSSLSVQHLSNDTEIGGTLWGRPGPGDSVLILNGALAASSGARFNTSAVDTRNLAQALNSPAPDPSLSLIGFFRSHVREGLALSPEDRALVTQHLQDPDSVILLLKPFQAGVCTAAFFFWNNGLLQDASALEVPFIVENAARPEAGIPPDPQDEASIVNILRQSALRHRTLHPAKHPPEPIAARRPEPLAKRPVWPTLITAGLIALLLGIVGGSAVFFWPILRPYLQAAPADTAGIGIELKVAPGDDGRLQLSWNRNAPGILKAHGGTLIINDGRFSPKLPLTPDQLRSGKLLYAPKTAHVQFRLALDLDGSRTLTESVLISPAKRQPRTAPSARRPAQPAAPVRPDSPPAASGAVETARANDVPVGVPAMVRLSVPQIPPPNATAGGYVPPQAVQEMMPASTPAGQFAKISIQVSLDPQGRVTEARPEGPLGNDALTAIALSAARQWRFRPATLNGQAVPAEYTIIFAFHPQVP